MTDRDSLLLAIRLAPADDTPRLVYADWLIENQACDRDAATGEFIRLACDGRGPVGKKGGRRRRPEAAAWLRDNWHRLVPGLFVKANGAGGIPGFPPRWLTQYRVCAAIPFVLPVSTYTRAVSGLEAVVYRPHITLTWDRGFATHAVWKANQLGADYIAPALAVDQPLALQHGPGAISLKWPLPETAV